MNPTVKSVKIQDDYRLLLTFVNGEERVFEMRPYLNMGVFSRLKDQAIFSSARVISGSVEWNGEIDLSYDTLYIESRPVKKSPARRKATR